MVQVGIKVNAKFECKECRQKFDSEKAKDVANFSRAEVSKMVGHGESPGNKWPQYCEMRRLNLKVAQTGV